jgi:hypothetical protein
VLERCIAEIRMAATALNLAEARSTAAPEIACAPRRGKSKSRLGQRESVWMSIVLAAGGAVLFLLA